jgi:hypothetical protein
MGMGMGMGGGMSGGAGGFVGLWDQYLVGRTPSGLSADREFRAWLWGKLGEISGV